MWISCLLRLPNLTRAVSLLKLLADKATWSARSPISSDAIRRTSDAAVSACVIRLAINIPGLAALNDVPAAVDSVSWAPAGGCAAGGSYTDGHGRGQGFVVSEKIPGKVRA